MWAKAVVLMLLVPACRADYHDESDYRNDDFDDSYEETETTMPVLTTTPMDSNTNVRRYGNQKKRSLGSQEMRQVKDALRDIFANRRIEGGAAAELSDTSIPTYMDPTGQIKSYNVTFKSSYPGGENQTVQFSNESQKPADISNGTTMSLNTESVKTMNDTSKRLPLADGPLVTESAYTTKPYEAIPPTQDATAIDEVLEERHALKEAVKRLNRKVEYWQPEDATNTILTSILEYLDNSTEKTLNPKEIEAVDEAIKRFVSHHNMVTRSSLRPENGSLKAYGDHTDSMESMISTETELHEITEDDIEDSHSKDIDVLRQRSTKKRKKGRQEQEFWFPKKKKPKTTTTPIPSGMMVNGVFETFPAGWPYRVTTCPTTMSTSYRLDVHGMLKLLANLTYEYDMNLVERFNESLYAYSIPTCPTYRFGYGIAIAGGKGRTTILDFDNTTVVAKCFVCGLKATHIPHDAYCGDAFAGDFLPLVPIDPRARGHIARYRKYCRYIDSRNPIEIPEYPRAVYGRFSGGCSVRWTDLTNVYTQRTCRSKRRAVTGNHFASKRMAKLEMALNHVDNGCIISPMATLLPLSRGISLYARFHVCVCTGAWCNKANINAPFITNIIIIFWTCNVLNFFKIAEKGVRVLFSCLLE